MTVTAASSGCRVQARPDPKEPPPLLELMRTLEGPSKTLYQPQMKVCNYLTTMPSLFLSWICLVSNTSLIAVFSH
jgi:hypothetical protein